LKRTECKLASYCGTFKKDNDLCSKLKSCIEYEECATSIASPLFTATTSPPTSIPTILPTSLTTSTPTSIPTSLPTLIPTSIPTSIPTFVPTSIPTVVPTSLPTSILTIIPTSVPTVVPTSIPTSIPTLIPTSSPTSIPTFVPSTPTKIPTSAPTLRPTSTPSSNPTFILISNLKNITTYAGNGVQGFYGNNNVTATSAQMSNAIRSITFDTIGNLYFGDSGNCVIRKIIVSTNIVTSVAGCGCSGCINDWGYATNHQLGTALNVAVDSIGFYFYYYFYYYYYYYY
jgi:hypothetical protein